MITIVFAVIIVAIPLVTVIAEWCDNSVISERHHSHHDTYVVPRSISSTLMLMMLFVGVLGLVIGWLCTIGVFEMDVEITWSFFAAFLMVSFAIWMSIRRYRIVTYDDRLSVTPFIGVTSTLLYANIKRLCWTRNTLGGGFRSLRIYGDNKSLFLWGIIDLEQILNRIDRYDALEGFTQI